MKTIPEKNIEWLSVKPTDNVELRGLPGSLVYVVNGNFVAFWGSQDAIRAQKFLNQRVIETQQRLLTE